MDRFHFASGQRAVLEAGCASVFFDGTFSDPRLSHPEGVAVGPDGWIWAGTEAGDIVRISPDGKQIRKAAATGGFILGLAFDGDRALFACDLKHKAVFRLDLADGSFERFTSPGIGIPNYPLVDRKRNALYVSDSSDDASNAHPCIWSYGLDGGSGQPWLVAPHRFSNGLAMRPGEDAIYVCQSFGPSISRVAINPDGSAGAETVFAGSLPGMPDGIAFDSSGNLAVGCYEPSRLLRISPDGSEVRILAKDPTAHTFCHPTNIAFCGNRLFTANLGRWHITAVDVDIGARPLWEQSA